MSSNLVRLLVCGGGSPRAAGPALQEALAVFLAHSGGPLSGSVGQPIGKGLQQLGSRPVRELSLGYVSPKGSLTCLPHQPVPGVPHTL